MEKSVEWSLWERARRYRLIAAVAIDDDATRVSKRAARQGEDKIKIDKQESRLGKLSAAD